MKDTRSNPEINSAPDLLDLFQPGISGLAGESNWRKGILHKHGTQAEAEHAIRIGNFLWPTRILRSTLRPAVNVEFVVKVVEGGEEHEFSKDCDQPYSYIYLNICAELRMQRV